MKRKLLGILAIIIAIGALLGIYYTFRERPANPNAGPSSDGVTEKIEKSVTIEVVDENKTSTLYTLSTHAEYLEGAMNEAEGLVFETNDGMVMVVNGTRADYVLDGAYWAFYVNGEYCNYGISDQPVNDGDKFRIEYTRA